MKGSTITIVLGAIFFIGYTICKTPEARRWLGIFFAAVAGFLAVTGIWQWVLGRRGIKDDDPDTPGGKDAI